MIQTSDTGVKEFFENSFNDSILSKSRRTLLVKIANTLRENYLANHHQAALHFICTHNSRRSQLGQVWAFFAARYFQLNIASFSGGTEVTAFHRNTVKTLKEVGFSFCVQEFSHQNPVYQISYKGTEDILLGFSKIYDHPENKAPYIAITTCDNADENCPYIADATERFHLPYTDPKKADGTPQQENAYRETSKIIASEIYFIFDLVARQL